MANTSKDTDKSIKKGSAAEAAGWTNSTSTPSKKVGNVVMPAVSFKSYQTESPENMSKKYPGLSLQEEAQIEANPQLSTIAKERMYQEMVGKKQERAWLNDRSDIRKQYINKTATTGNEDDDRTMVYLSQTLDGVREEIINAGGKGVNKVDDMELVNIIGETNPHTSDIINSVTRGDMPVEYATYFLLNPDEYGNIMSERAAQNPTGQSNTDGSGKKKAGRFESFVEGAFSTVKGATKTLAKLGVDALTTYNPLLLPVRGVDYLISGEDHIKKGGQIAKNVIEEATTQWDEDVNADRKLRKGRYGAGKLVGEAGLMTMATGLGGQALHSIGGPLATKLGTTAAGSKYAPQIAKGIEVIDKIGNTGGGKAAKRVLGRMVDGIAGGLTIQGVSDLVEGEISDKKDYMTSIEIATILGVAGDIIGMGFKKFANPGKKVSEIVQGEGGLNGTQINQIENEVKTFNSTNKAQNPFKIRAAEVKSQAIPQLDGEIKTVSAERDVLVKNMINDGQKSAKEYVSNLNKALKEADLGNIEVVVTKSGKLKVTGGTTAGSEAEKQLKEFVDMINAQSDGGTKSLVDAIKSAKQISKEAQIAGKSTKMTKAITDFSKELEGQVKELYPEVWEQVSKKNSELSDLLGMKNKIVDLGDDYSALAGKMNSDTDFYNFMDDLYKRGYTSEHFGNKTLGTYYTMGLRAPQLLSEQAKLFYPSVPGLEEAGLRYLQGQIKQTYGGLGALAGEEVTTPMGAWAKMGADVGQIRAANNR